MTATLAARPEHRVRRALGSLIPPAVFGIGFVVVWELIVQGFDLKPYFLPAPSAIAEAFVDNFGHIKDAAFVSGGNALVGLIG